MRVALTDTAYVSVKTMNEAFRDPRLWRSRRQRANVSRLVRTGIVLIAFGFVVEKFNLFILTMASISSPDAGYRLQLDRMSGPFGRYDGLALVVGLALIVAAAVRFVRIGWRLNDQETHSVISLRAELIVSAALALIVAGIGGYLVLGR